MEQKKHKDLHYPFRGFRIADETYEKLKQEKKESETWNIFFKRLISKKTK
jgi:predicted CopG family antitoxin